MNPQTRKMVLDFAPLVAFFAVYKFAGIYPATATVIVASLLCAGISYAFERRIAPMPVITAVVVCVMGGLTLYLHDATFIMMKPTFIYAALGIGIIGSELIGKPVFKLTMGTAMPLREHAWRALAFRFGGFFFFMAAANEVVWRNFSRDVWVDYHLFGAMGLTFLFALCQMPFMMRNAAEDETPQSAGAEKKK